MFNLKLKSIPVTPGIMVKKIITDLDTFRVSGPACIPEDGFEELWTWTFIHISLSFQYVLERILMSRLLESLTCRPCFTGILVKGVRLKNTLLLFFLLIIKSLKNMQIIGWLIISRNLPFLFLLWFQVLFLICRFSDNCI